MTLFVNLEGRTFGDLQVVKKASSVGTKIRYVCQCSCGRETIVQGSNLTTGHTRSCGHVRGQLRGEQLRLPHGDAIRNRILSTYKDHARQRSIPFELPKEDFNLLIKSNCFYCGSPPSTARTARRSGAVLLYNGIDRVDNNQGYSKENCVPCCSTCNRAKGTLTTEDFRAWINQLFYHLNKTETHH